MKTAAYFILVSSWMLCSAAPVRGQEADDAKTRQVEIIHAGLLQLTSREGRPVELLTDSVVLRQEETLVSAQTAIRFSEGDEIRLSGEVQIVEEGDTLAADEVIYFTNTKIGTGTGNVRWADGDVTMTAAEGKYFLDDRRAEFSKEVTFRDSSATVTGVSGVYLVDERRATFVGSVRLRQDSLLLSADTLIHEREADRSRASGNVMIVRRDSADTVTSLVAETVQRDGPTGKSRYGGGTTLLRVEGSRASRDTLVVNARDMVVVETDSVDSISAVNDVVVWQNRFQATADSLFYTTVGDTLETRITLFGDPILWSGQTQLGGDTVAVRLSDGKIESIHVPSSARVSYRDTTLDRIQQIRGTALEGYFINDTLETLRVQPAAEALYFTQDEDTGERKVVEMTSRRIDVRFKNGAVASIKAVSDIEGEVRPEPDETLPSIPGLEWLESKRPRFSEVTAPRLLAAVSQAPRAPDEGETEPMQH